MSREGTSSIPIFVASDSGSQHGMVVTVESALDRASPDFRFEVHIGDAGLDPDVRKSMREEWSKHPKVGSLVFHDLSLDSFNGLFTKVRLRPATLARLQMPDLITNAPRAIYLDTDILVLGDLKELASLEFGDTAVAGVIDNLPTLRDQGYDLDGLPFHVPPETPYINAGFLVANLDYWRRHDFWERGKVLLSEHSDKFSHFDQSVLNLLCAGKLHILPNRWNRQRQLVDELPMALQKASLVHFIGPIKPWHFGYRPGCGTVAMWHEQLRKSKVKLPPLPPPSRSYRGPLLSLYLRKLSTVARIKVRV
jgi:lipopolysaccharide biosynthesis glycosyltransferase